MKQTILFIINPISGGKSKLNFPSLVEKCLDTFIFCPSFIFTTGAGHARKIALDHADKNIIVAVGGDGTINEVASVLVKSGQRMGIIPCGSGNGLARSLGIPLKEIDAIVRLNSLRSVRIDSGILNDRHFFNMAGVGFDAHISHQFATHIKRGLIGYVQTTFREIKAYRPKNYTLILDGKTYNRTAFMISIANSSQYGNDAHISPFASLDDGLLDICVIKPFPLYLFPDMVYRMFNRTAHLSRFVEIIKAKHMTITRDKSDLVHVDGEPLLMDAELNITIKPLSLSVLT